jgi:hypothetical protein
MIATNSVYHGQCLAASYATYFLHPLVLTAIKVLFGPLAVAPELRLLIVAVLAVPVCFLTGDAATRFLGITCRGAGAAPGMVDVLDECARPLASGDMPDGERRWEPPTLRFAATASAARRSSTAAWLRPNRRRRPAPRVGHRMRGTSTTSLRNPCGGDTIRD